MNVYPSEAERERDKLHDRHIYDSRASDDAALLWHEGGDGLIPDNIAIVREFPNHDIRIHPIFDLHIGAAEFMEREWLDYKRQILADPNAYVVIGGDLINNGIKSSVTNVYEEVMRPREQKKRLMEELEPLRDRIICGTGGNHCFRTAKEADQNPMYDVFCKLNIEDRYRENGCFAVLRFGDKKACSRDNPTYQMGVFHGAGGGMYIGSGANRIERFGSVIEGLDLIITGHTHKPLSFPVGRLVFDSRNGKVVKKQFRVLVATSWLEYGGYPMRGLMAPTAFCPNEAWLCGTHKEIKITQ